MTNTDYKIGKNLNCITKHNIHYDATQILNYTCANYITEIIQEGVTYNLSEEDKERLLSLINKLQK